MSSADSREYIARYQALLERYHALGRVISELLLKHSGGDQQMDDEDLARYRVLAQERDEIFNEMRLLEQELFDDVN